MTLHPSVIWYSTDPAIASVRLVPSSDNEPIAVIVATANSVGSTTYRLTIDPTSRVIVAIHAPGPVPSEDEIAAALVEPVIPSDLSSLSDILERLDDSACMKHLATLPARLLRRRQRLQERTIVLDPRAVAT